MVRVVSTGICYVIEDIVAIQPESLGDLDQSSWPESSLRVDIQCLTLATALVEWKLTGDTQGVAELCLSSPKLTKELSDRTSFDTTCAKLGYMNTSISTDRQVAASASDLAGVCPVR